MIPSAGRSGTSPSISAFIPVLIHLFTRLLSQYPLINPHSGTGLRGVLGAGTPVSSTLWAWSCALLYEAMRASWGPRARGLGSRVPQTGCDSQPGPHRPQRPVLAPPRGQHAAGVWGQDTLRGCSESTARPCSHSHPGLPGPESTVGAGGFTEDRSHNPVCWTKVGVRGVWLGPAGLWGGPAPQVLRAAQVPDLKAEPTAEQKPTSCHMGSYVKIPFLTRQQNSKASYAPLPPLAGSEWLLESRCPGAAMS